MKILFLGFYHHPNDPRLYYRQIKVLKQVSEDIRVFFLSQSQLLDLSNGLDRPSEIKQVLSNQKEKNKQQLAFLNSIRKSLKITYDDFKRNIVEFQAILKFYSEISKMKPDIIQASDVRELHWAILICFFTGSKVVYDVHEDFFNQIYEYAGKSKLSFLKALISEVKEYFLMQFVDAIFCTDDYLFEKYSRLIGKRKTVGLLRSFPLIINNFPQIIEFKPKNILNLVYIGSVNQYRGVSECAEYVSKFNQRFNDKKLTFTVYSKTHPIIDNLVKRSLIQHIPSLDYAELMKELMKYDIGICLLHRIKKFERNLPLKNFDYMSVGLPIITSNFGNLKKYADESDAAISIDPLSYLEFESAILLLFNEQERKRLSENGVNYAKGKASFYNEAKEYLKVFLS